MAERWKITKDRAQCEEPGCPLRRSDDYWAVLELPSCLRRDFCQRCFRERSSAEGEPPLFWRGKRKPKDQKGPTLDLPSLRQLFDRLGDDAAMDGTDTDEARETVRGLRYLVALLLLRKRVLTMVDPTTPEQEAADLVVVDPKVEGMEPVSLLAPELDDERLGKLRDELLGAVGS
ncbi:MAG: hypothetical protein AAF628_37785 [Planctomycetota bacterium]